MSENKVIISTDQEISDALTDAIAQQAITPMADQFLETGTAANMNTYGVNFPAKIVLRNNALGLQNMAIEAADIAFEKLKNRISHHLNCLNDHIIDGDYPVGVRSFYGLPLDSGVHYEMITPTQLIAAAGRIAAGNAAMVTNGYTAIVDFSAASVAALLVTFNTKNGLRNNAKQAHDDAIGVVDTMRPLALAAALQVQLEVENNFNHLDAPTMRTYCKKWGLKYETEKVETAIKIICFMPDGITVAAGADLRIGQVLTKDGKVAKEGVHGLADAEGTKTLDTKQVGDQFVIARLMGCADNHTPITIVAGVPQTITVHFVAGTSTL